MDKFNIQKTLACAAYVCQSNKGKFDKLSMITVLYIAERDTICETFNVMTGDKKKKYPFGPVLKHLYDALRGKASTEFQKEWDSHFENPKSGAKSKGANDVKLIKTPDMDELSYANRLFLDRALKFVNSCKKGTLVDTAHEFPEWDMAVRRGIKDIDLADILTNYRKDLTSKEVLEIKAEIQRRDRMNLIGRVVHRGAKGSGFVNFTTKRGKQTPVLTKEVKKEEFQSILTADVSVVEYGKAEEIFSC